MQLITKKIDGRSIKYNILRNGSLVYKNMSRSLEKVMGEGRYTGTKFKEKPFFYETNPEKKLLLSEKDQIACHGFVLNLEPSF